MKRALAAFLGVGLWLASSSASAQQPGGYWSNAPGGPWPNPGYAPQPSYYATVPPRTRTDLEIGTLYGVSAAYGVGLGVWFSSELDIDDPGVFLIPPALLGVAAPAGVWLLDQPSMPRGMPAAIATGMLIGAGEGIGIAGYQHVTADEADEWSFQGLARATALGSTLGAIGGYAAGYYLEPSPRSSVLIGSAAVWGSAIGAMYGYGASEAGIGYGRANDSAALGGLVGYNLGIALTAAMSTIYIPTWDQLAWMWMGSGIGAAASLPVFLFYADDGGPPAKRGFLFMGTATTLGLAAGAIFASDEVQGYELGKHDDGSPFDGGRGGRSRWASITSVGPLAIENGGGVSVSGVLH